MGHLPALPETRLPLAQLSDGNTETDAIVRLSDGKIVWQGSAGTSGFTSDDRRFVYFPSGISHLPFVVDPATGAEIDSTSTLIPSPDITTFELLAVLDTRAVFTASWLTYGVLWTVDWQGKVTPFESDVPMQINDILQGFDPAGTKAVWSRQGIGTGTNLGALEIDLASNGVTPWNGPDFSCFGRPGEVFFKIVANDVQSCACDGRNLSDHRHLPRRVRHALAPASHRIGTLTLRSAGAIGLRDNGCGTDDCVPRRRASHT